MVAQGEMFFEGLSRRNSFHTFLHPKHGPLILDNGAFVVSDRTKIGYLLTMKREEHESIVRRYYGSLDVSEIIVRTECG